MEGGWSASECTWVTFWCLVRHQLLCPFTRGREVVEWYWKKEHPSPRGREVTLLLSRVPELGQVPAPIVATSFSHIHGRYQSFPHELRQALELLKTDVPTGTGVQEESCLPSLVRDTTLELEWLIMVNWATWTNPWGKRSGYPQASLQKGRREGMRWTWRTVSYNAEEQSSWVLLLTKLIRHLLKSVPCLFLSPPGSFKIFFLCLVFCNFNMLCL